MFHIALFEPEIPPNTGNIIRLCANTGCQLHVIKPLGFSLNDKQLRRAGLDYHEFSNLQVHDDFAKFKQHIGNKRLFACSTKAKQQHSDITYQKDDVFLFGPETRGLPASILKTYAKQLIRIPMLPTSRSLNLSNSVGIIVYEAWRQLGFEGC